ncbi:MAG: hypothetical protein M1528_00440 [Candidatus Marsarchaeota archaeon]|jgi:hypothetical protein|nr:hypothetical protein [Candidatus Marsarchaeota archaeon]MCL5114997.1 hypothetical protein [Candidatus Marsarchaeota archaeon]
MAGSADAYLVGGVTYPPSEEHAKIYKNIEDEPLIWKIKELEARLPDGFSRQKETTESQKEVLKLLLDDFEKLLKVKYGSLGYLVSTPSEYIVHKYGVDTDEDFCYLEGGSSIQVRNGALNRMVTGGGGRAWMGERGLLISDPEENQVNIRMTDDAIKEIMAAIKKRLQP